jgi:hypothetical protein
MRTAHRVPLIAALLSLGLLSESGHASWWSDITGINIDVPVGRISFDRPHPEHIPAMLQNLPKDVGQAVFNPLGASMATLIRQAYSQALPGSQPIPPDIRRTLAPFFPPFILDKARWTGFDGNRLSFDSAIMGLNCNVSAVTVDNVIVFRSRADGASDWGLWAHELIHVSQYHNMGVEGFANLYILSAGRTLEDPAYSWANHVAQTAQPNQSVGTFWSASPQATQGNSFSDAQFLDAARSVYPAEVCTAWNTVQFGANVSNNCRVPIRIVGWQQQDPVTGNAFTIQCTVNCGLNAFTTNLFVSPRPGSWTNVFFDFPGFPNAGDNLPETWTYNSNANLSQPPPVTNLFPSGYALSACGCWGYVAPGASMPNVACSLGVEMPRACSGWCQGGGSPWQRICQ